MKWIREWGQHHWRRWKDSTLGSDTSVAAIERTLSLDSAVPAGQVEAHGEAILRLQDEIDRIGPVAPRAGLWLCIILGLGAGGFFVVGGTILVMTKGVTALFAVIWGLLLWVWVGHVVSLERRKDQASRTLHHQLRAASAGDVGPGPGSQSR